MEYFQEFIVITISGLIVALFSAMVTKFDVFKPFSKQRKKRVEKLQQREKSKVSFLIWFYKNSKYFFVIFYYLCVIAITLGYFKMLGHVNFSVVSVIGVPILVFYLVLLCLCTISSMYCKDLENKISDEERNEEQQQY